MAAGFASVSQQDFSAGVYRGRSAPKNALYDAVNALIDDEGQLFRRGATTYPDVADTFSLRGLGYAQVLGAMKGFTWGATKWRGITASIGSSTYEVPVPWSRGAGVGGMWIAPANSGSYDLVLYGGAATSAYTTGTISVGVGDTGIVGVGTSWEFNVDPGSILTVTGQTVAAVLQAGILNTSAPLRDPWYGTAVAGGAYRLAPVQEINPLPGGVQGVTCVAAVGTPPRLLAAAGPRIWFSEPGQPMNFGTGRYHELLDNAVVLGMDAIGDTAMIFTTAGVWVIANMNLDPLDPLGNTQHTVARVSKDVILWGDPGIAGWAGGLIVPGTYDVYVMSPSGETQTLSEGIRPLYRSYVEAGYGPGTAAVYRGHYLLPIVNGTTLVDVLVCRLDRGAGWTRWADHAAGGAYVVQTGTANPSLYGVNGQRVTGLAGCFTQGSSTDADGTVFSDSYTTRDFDTGPGMKPNNVQQVRLKYEMAGAGAVAVSWSTGAEGAAFTGLTAVKGGGLSDGTTYSVWNLNKARERLRLKITRTGAATKFILREIELLIRQTGRS